MSRNDYVQIRDPRDPNYPDSSSTTVAIPRDDVVFDLDAVGPLFENFLLVHSRHAEDARFLTEFKQQIRQLSGDANVYRFRGRIVATDDRNGKFSVKELERLDPDLCAEYTRIVAKEMFDEEAFRKDHPDLWERLRAQSFRIK